MLVKGGSLQAVVNDVLYVPELRSNLFSVRRLEDVGMTVKFAGGRVSIEKGDRMVGSGRRSGQLYALDIFRRGGVEDGGKPSCEIGGGKSAEEQAEDVPADKPPRNSENEGKEVRIAGSSGRQPGVAELLEAEDKEGPNGALPSQPERDNCSAEVSTRPSGRERKIVGSTGPKKDSETNLARNAGAESIVGNLPADGAKQCWRGWSRQSRRRTMRRPS
ncbi:uncharacterized protein LOC128093433 [Culex pipiens pallens]|uniref:uncharacterized protein LOC128093433 n=1 Tax=Culex pipiens pallens TaxID=42434 RepID=UPI0022AA965B|nr:uncharacterized protein LOC128093433 [Culex pipiens pallens]